MTYTLLSPLRKAVLCLSLLLLMFFLLKCPSLAASETFDGVTAPALPSTLTASDPTYWATSATTSFSSPNALVHAGTSAAYTIPTIYLNAQDASSGQVNVDYYVRFEATNTATQSSAMAFFDCTANPGNWSTMTAYRIEIDRSAGVQTLRLSNSAAGTDTKIGEAGYQVWADNIWYHVFATRSGSSLTVKVQRQSDGAWLNTAAFVADASGNTTAIAVTDASPITVPAGGGWSGLAFYSGGYAPPVDMVRFDSLTVNGTSAPSVLAEGAVTTSGVTSTAVTINAAAAAGGTGPYSYQFQRSLDNGSNAPVGASGSDTGWAAVGAAGAALTRTDSGLTAGTKYWYRVKVVDTATTPATVYSVATSATTPRTAISYYFSLAGNDSTGTGAIGSPYATAAKANTLLASAVPGDKYLFNGGQTFSLTAPMVVTGQGQGTGTVITISSYGTGFATLSCAAGIDAVDVVNTGGVTASNLILTGPATNGADTPASIRTRGVSVEASTAGPISYKYVTLSNLTVTGFDWGIKLWSHAAATNAYYEGARIVSCTVHDCPELGIVIRGFQSSSGPYQLHTSVLGCTIYNVPGLLSSQMGSADDDTTGISLIFTDQKYSTVERCVVHDGGGGANASAGPGGIVLLNAQNCVVQRCEVYRMATLYQDGVAIDLDASCVNCIVRHNYTHDNAGSGLMAYQFLITGLPGWGPNTYEYNVSANDANASSQGAARFSSNTQGLTFARNTVYVKTGHAFDLAYVEAASGNGMVVDNLFICESGAAFTVIPASTGTLYKFVGNDYYQASGTPSFSGATGTYTSLATWAAGDGQETLDGVFVGLSASPGLASAIPSVMPTLGPGVNTETLTAFNLGPASPLIDAGLPLLRTTGLVLTGSDLHGNPAVAGAALLPDIGAVEYPTGGYAAGGTPSLIIKRRIN